LPETLRIEAIGRCGVFGEEIAEALERESNHSPASCFWRAARAPM
jgi:hypothetical protein